MNTRSRIMAVLSLVLVAAFVLSACQPQTVTVVETVEVPGAATTVEVEVPVVETVEVPVEVIKEVFVTPTPAPTTRKGAWLDEVVFSVVSSDSAVTQLNAAAIDIYASQLSSADKPEIEAAGLNYATANGLYYELTFNPVGPTFEGTGKLNPFSSTKIREAMNWLVDRDYINQEVYEGGALAKYFSIVTQFPDYTNFADVVSRLENEYAYNFEKAQEVISAEMEAMGATLVDGKWNFNGEPVTIIFLIRTDSDGTRVPIGDYVSNQLEDVGFTVDRQYKTSSEASPLWVQGNPADGLWHIYTGAWSASIIDRDEGDNFQFFEMPSSAYGFSALWQAYEGIHSAEYVDLADKLAYNNFATLEERNEAFRQALEFSIRDSVRVWLIDGKGFIPYRDGIEVAYDLAAGVDGSQIWPHTLRFAGEEGGRMNWGQPDLFVDPWNGVAGSNWAFDQSAIRGTDDAGIMYDPYTGLVWPHRIERAEVTVLEGLPVGKTLDWLTLDFAPSIEVPGDAWVDWDATNQVFVTASEKFTETQTAQVKSVVYYPADLYDTVKWHDGSNISAADFVMGMIMNFDTGKAESAIFDESQASTLEAFLAQFKGMRVVSTDPLVIEHYSDGFQLDAELNVTTWWPAYAGYGDHAWHQIAVANLADAAGELAYSADKADAAEIEWLSFIGGPSLDILDKYLDQATAESYIPYAPTLGAYLTADEAAARYANLKAWYGDRGHFWLGTGPFSLGKVFLTEKTLTLRRFPDYPNLANRWSTFGSPKIATVELDGPGQVTIGQEATYDIFIDFQGDPYPTDQLKDVKILLFDATGASVFTGSAEAVADGHYQFVLPADVSSALAAGANKLQVAVVSKVVAIPTFTSLEFVTAP